MQSKTHGEERLSDLPFPALKIVSAGGPKESQQAAFVQLLRCGEGTYILEVWLDKLAPQRDKPIVTHRFPLQE